eukprot:2439435-Prymnesium_polylepis.2
MGDDRRSWSTAGALPLGYLTSHAQRMRNSAQSPVVQSARCRSPRTVAPSVLRKNTLGSAPAVARVNGSWSGTGSRYSSMRVAPPLGKPADR